MSGYFERLVQRAQGGAALAGSPVIRPLPAIYQGTNEERDAADASLEVEAETFASERIVPSAQYPTMDRPEAMPAAIPPAGKPSREREGDVRQRVDQPVFVERGAFPPPLEQRAATVKQRRQTKEDTPPPTPQSRPEHDGPAASPPAEIRSYMSIEQIADAIEATPPAPRAAATELWPIHSPERGDVQPPPPSVSIGRIDIVVAQPPLPATRTEGTRGFKSYSRLRRGLAR